MAVTFAYFRLLFIVFVILVGTPPLLSVEACSADSTNEYVQALRDSVRDAIRPEDLGAGYVALLNFAVNPDISAATYKIDGGDGRGDDFTLDVYRLPLCHVFTSENLSFRPFVAANFAYQTYGGNRIYLDDRDSIGTAYEAYGGSATLGAEIPIFDPLVLLVAVNSGIAHLENRADYYGVIAENLLRPALAGLVFDWDADAWLTGVSAGMQYSRKLDGNEYRATIDVTFNHFATYETSSDFVEFEANATTCSLQLESLFPLPGSLFGMPLALATSLGHTSFYGQENDALGFSYFFEAGVAIETDVAEHDIFVKKMRFGAKAMAGEDVIGWSLILGYRF
jgi:hypothetical protein